VNTPPVRERVGPGEALGPALRVLLPPERWQVGLTEDELRAGPPPLDPDTFEVAPPGKPGKSGLTQAELERLLRSQGPPPAVIEPGPKAHN
jgi:hypothetical protein